MVLSFLEIDFFLTCLNVLNKMYNIAVFSEGAVCLEDTNLSLKHNFEFMSRGIKLWVYYLVIQCTVHFYIKLLLNLIW